MSDEKAIKVKSGRKTITSLTRNEAAALIGALADALARLDENHTAIVELASAQKSESK